MAYVVSIAYPTVTVTPATGVEITTFDDSMSYSAFVTSLNSIMYKIKYIYFQCTNLAQLSQNYVLNRLDPKGETLSNHISPNPTPYQFQPSYYYDGREDEFIINSLNTLDFNLLPGTTLQLFLYCDSVSYEYLEYPDDDLPDEAQQAIAVIESQQQPQSDKVAKAATVMIFGAGILLGVLIAKIVRK